LEGGEHPVRFALTTEAGLNDGLAFPFVYLALFLASGEVDAAGWLGWFGWDVVWRIGVGALVGGGLGWTLGRILFAGPSGGSLSDSGPGVLALASVFLCYGAAELAEGYGFIAVFVAGLAVRRAEVGHSYHQKLHAFCESIEDAITAILLVLLGAVAPLLWPFLDWRHALIGLSLLLVVRPLAGLIGLIGTGRPSAERGLIAFYGVRGVGSIYYVGYAAAHMEFIDEGPIWALVVFTVFASTVVHGLTAPGAVRRFAEAPRPDG
jgi:NhaP-type Na+/H+ or K+/H+ antiporter